MSLGIYEEEEIRAISDKIRELTGEETKYTTAEMPAGVTEAYGKGLDEGAELVNRTLFGVYILKENVDIIRDFVNKYGSFVEDFTGKGVYSHFWDMNERIYKYIPVGKMVGGAGDWYPYELSFYSTYEEETTGYRIFCADYDDGSPFVWSSEIGDWYDGLLSGYNGDSTPAQSRIFVFTQPTAVPQVVYDVFAEITDNSAPCVADAKVEGEQLQYNTFWNSYQNNGRKTDYYRAFCGEGWNNTTFKPKYNMNVSESATEMFQSCNITHLKTALEKAGVTLTFSPAHMSSVFETSNFVVIDGFSITVKPANYKDTFNWCDKLTDIKVPLPVHKDTTFENTFYRCTSLVNVSFDGVIGQNGLNLSFSTKLSKASFENVVGCLASDVSGKSITFSIDAVNVAFETSKNAKDGSTSEEWLNLIATKPNWTIKLV